MVVVINPARADAVDTEAIVVLTAGKSDPEDREFVIVHLDIVNQAKTFLQGSDYLCRFPIPARTVIQRRPHFEAIDADQMPMIMFGVKRKHVLQGPLA